MENKKILELCLSDSLGGLELFLDSCYRSFSQYTECKVIVSPNENLDDYLDKSNEISYIKRSRIFLIFNAYKLAKYIDEHEIDIVHFHWTKDMALVVLGKALSKRKPKIIQSRHMGMTKYKNDLYHKYLYKNISLIHTVTKKVEKQVKTYVPKNESLEVETIYLGTDEKQIDLDIVNNLKKTYHIKNEFVVGIAGRIEEPKGQHLVIEALEKIKELNIKAVIIGSTMDDNYLKKLYQKVKEYRLEDRVIFTGFTRKVDEHMQMCNTIVLATENETFGLVVIEAMVNKSCVIATNRGGPLEIIDNMKNGILFNRTADDLANKLRLLYEKPGLKNKIALAGYETVKKKFNQKEQLLKLYNVMQKVE